MKKNNSTKKGFAILFTLVIISIISLISFGISNTTIKELVLSSVATDSQVAFYQSDTATECALYADIIGKSFVPGAPTPVTTITCGVDANNTSLSSTITPSGPSTFTVAPASSTPNAPCFEMTVVKSTSGATTTTNIKSRGYNICNKSNPRTVEREIEVTY